MNAASQTRIWAITTDFRGHAQGTYEAPTAEAAIKAWREESGEEEASVTAVKVKTHRHYNPATLEWMTDDEAVARYGESCERFGWNGPKAKTIGGALGNRIPVEDPHSLKYLPYTAERLAQGVEEDGTEALIEFDVAGGKVELVANHLGKRSLRRVVTA